MDKQPPALTANAWIATPNGGEKQESISNYHKWPHSPQPLPVGGARSTMADYYPPSAPNGTRNRNLPQTPAITANASKSTPGTLGTAIYPKDRYLPAFPANASHLQAKTDIYHESDKNWPTNPISGEHQASTPKTLSIENLPHRWPKASNSRQLPQNWRVPISPKQKQPPP